MDEELVEKLTQYIEVTEDFMAREAPLVVQEILYRPWIDLLSLIPCFVVIYGGYRLSKYLYGKADWKEFDYFAVASVIITTMFSAIAFCAIMSLCFNITDCAQAYFTPRLYILEYLASLT